MSDDYTKGLDDMKKMILECIKEQKDYATLEEFEQYVKDNL